MIKRWHDEEGLHLDLRGLEPPQPMVAILSEIESGATGPLILHMDRDPIFLYQELEDRGWSWRQGQPDGQTPVILELRPDDAAP